MIVDSSVWIDFSRGAKTSRVDVLTRALLDGTAMTTDAVRLEILAGVGRDDRAERVAAALDGCHDLAQKPRTDVEDAASIFRRCRLAGETIRSLNDCLIAAIAIRHQVPVLHRDRDFDVIAAHSGLDVVLA